jgi:hypothetical protein
LVKISERYEKRGRKEEINKNTERLKLANGKERRKVSI